jgi:hypothetical protein
MPFMFEGSCHVTMNGGYFRSNSYSFQGVTSELGREEGLKEWVVIGAVNGVQLEAYQDREKALCESRCILDKVLICVTTHSPMSNRERLPQCAFLSTLTDLMRLFAGYQQLYLRICSEFVGCA